MGDDGFVDFLLFCKKKIDFAKSTEIMNGARHVRRDCGPGFPGIIKLVQYKLARCTIAEISYSTRFFSVGAN